MRWFWRWLRNWWRETGLAVVVIIIPYVALCCGGCASNAARIEQHGDGKAEVDQKQGVLIIDEVKKLIEAQIKGELDARAGTQEKTDQSTTGRDKTQSEAQQQGLFNLSWQEQAASGIGAGLIMAMTILLYSSRKQTERIELARAQREAEETKRDVLQYEFILKLLNKQAMPEAAGKWTRAEQCGRGRWPWSRCKTGVS